jgi:hypothetical protein
MESNLILNSTYFEVIQNDWGNDFQIQKKNLIPLDLQKFKSIPQIHFITKI